jgi:ketosteroid isomerase-like protein
MSPFKFSGPDPDRPKPFGELTLARGQIQGARVAQRQRELLEHLYDRFNARDMEAVLATMHRDVVWANGMEGGHVYGHDGVRDYWTRQWATVDSHVEAAGFSIGADGTSDVEVHLTARDLKRNLLFDKMGGHIFRIEDGLIRRFDIR